MKISQCGSKYRKFLTGLTHWILYWIVTRFKTGAESSRFKLNFTGFPYLDPNPSSHSWVSSYPFMSAHTYMSFLGNFPAIHGRESCPVSPFVSLAVLFSCAFVSLYPTAPIKTHMHRYAPVHTRPRPRLHWDV